MLLITRRRGEKFKIGDNVEVTLVGMRNGAAQIGIDAPRDVTVLRNELLPKPRPDNEGNTADRVEVDCEH